MQTDTPAQSLFLGLMGGPFTGDWTTNFFQIAEAALKRGTDVTVWTCGNATSMTQTTNIRPDDPIHADCPGCGNHTLAEMATALLDAHPDHLRWYVCRYCMEERGATAQIPQAQIQLPFSFNTYLNQADRSLVLGIK